jgi:hypothetical protein
MGIVSNVGEMHLVTSPYYKEQDIKFFPQTRCFYTVAQGTILGVWNNELSYTYGEPKQYVLNAPTDVWRMLETLMPNQGNV